jgi:S-formylglutathione hydrolase FrmB
MSTGSKFRTIGFALALSLAVLCSGIFTPAHAAQAAHRKVTRAKAKKAELPPLPSGPTGPVQAMPLDAIAAVPPQVTFENNELTIVAPNSTLADILRAVHKSTGADIDVPAAPERVVTHLGPGPARDVLADLLNGSRFNYVLLGAPNNDSALTRVVLVAKGANETATPNPPPTPQPQPGMAQMSAPPQEPAAEPNPPDGNDQGMVDDSNTVMDDNADQQPPAESADQAPTPDQPQVKTPQQMLQEMQQRQMQLQQQQQPGQPPVPGSGVQPHPPQEQ